MDPVVKAILMAAGGVILIVIDHFFAKRASKETQEYFTDSVREAYVKDGVRRNLMHFWGAFTVIGIILLILSASELVKLLFHVDIIGYIRNFIGF